MATLVQNLQLNDGFTPDKLTESVKNSGKAFQKLNEKIKSMATFDNIVKGGKKLMDLSDKISTIKVGLNFVNDGSQSIGDLEEKIYSSAQRSRTAYMETVATITNLGKVAGNAFSGNDEMIAFAEQMNKQFIIGGTSAKEQASTMNILTQAMASGNLKGSEFKNIMSSAPLLAQSIADEMGVTVNQLANMSSEGQIAADVIKNALLSSTNETNAKFNEIPITFSQLMTTIKDGFLQAFQPLLEIIGAGAQFIYDNWGIIGPIFYGLAAALGVYTVALGIHTMATNLAQFATSSFFTSLLSNPLTWLVMGIAAVITGIYSWVKSVGGIKIAWLMLQNVVLTVWEAIKLSFFRNTFFIQNKLNQLLLIIKTISVKIQNFIGDLKVKILLILQDIVNGAIGIANKFIGVVNKIFGTSIDLVQEVTFGETAKLDNEIKKKAREEGLKDFEDKINKQALKNDELLNDMEQKFANEKKQREDEIKKQQSLAEKAQQDNNIGIQLDTGNNNSPSGTQSDPVYSNANVNNTVEVSGEDLKVMRDMAEMQAIHNFVTLTPTVKVTTGDIRNDVDVNELIEGITYNLNEEVAANARGVYNV